MSREAKAISFLICRAYPSYPEEDRISIEVPVTEKTFQTKRRKTRWCYAPIVSLVASFSLGMLSPNSVLASISPISAGDAGMVAIDHHSAQMDSADIEVCESETLCSGFIP